MMADQIRQQSTVRKTNDRAAMSESKKNDIRERDRKRKAEKIKNESPSSKAKRQESNRLTQQKFRRLLLDKKRKELNDEAKLRMRELRKNETMEQSQLRKAKNRDRMRDKRWDRIQEGTRRHHQQVDKISTRLQEVDLTNRSSLDHVSNIEGILICGSKLFRYCQSH